MGALPVYRPVVDGRGKRVSRVRGLTAHDLDWLFQSHEDDAESLYTAWRASEDHSISSALMTAVRTSPELVMSVLAIASDPDDIEAERDGVARLPTMRRLSALADVVDLTFRSEGGLEDAVAKPEPDDGAPEDGGRRKPSRHCGRAVAGYVLTVRELVSFLAEHGHPDAADWPLARIFLNAEITQQRVQREQANEAVRMQKTIGSLIDERIGRDFAKWVNKVNGNGD